MDTFQSRLRKALEIREVKQIDLAKRMGTGRSTVSQWIHGRNNTGSQRAYQIAQVLNVDPSWLIGADVPFGSFQEAMQKMPSDNLNEIAIGKFAKLTDGNKKAVLGYIDGLLHSQNS